MEEADNNVLERKGPCYVGKTTKTLTQIRTKTGADGYRRDLEGVTSSGRGRGGAWGVIIDEPECGTGCCFKVC